MNARRFAVSGLSTLLLLLGSGVVVSCSGGGEDSSESGPQAIDISGTWLGTLDVPPVPIRVVFNIERSSDGEWTGTLDSPDQGGFDIPMTEIETSGNQVTFRIESIGVSFSGERVDAGQELAGTLLQGGEAQPVVLRKQPGPLDYGRPQDPTPPFPYNAADVSFASDQAGVTLAGTLLWPNGAGPFTTVVLISGSGPQNRDEELVGHRPFLVLADALARANVAVLRYDDRGVGASTGAFDAATTADFALDARGAVSFLKTQAMFSAGTIGLVGHSEGGQIAPMVADGNADVGFMVLLAAPGVDGKTTIISQSRAIGAAQGVSAAQLDASEAQLQMAYGCYDALDALDTCLRSVFAGAATAADIDALVATLDTPWLRFFVPYDPVPVLARTQIPVLALNGSLDLQVLPDINLPPIQSALANAGNPQTSVQILPGLNHLFQHAETGLPSEYAVIEETMAPEVLTLVSDWIQGVAPSAL